MPFIPNYLIWLVGVAALVALEAATLGLTCIWFALGALGALLVSFLGVSFLFQAVVFVVLSGISLILLKPFPSKHINSKRVATNADRVIGAEAVVTQDINNELGQGLVKVGGQIWSARSADDKQIIPSGSHVLVKNITGVKLTVEYAKENVK